MKLLSKVIGTMVLVLMDCGSAVSNGRTESGAALSAIDWRCLEAKKT